MANNPYSPPTKLPPERLQHLARCIAPLGARVLVEIFTELQNGADLSETLETYCTRVAPYADLVHVVAGRGMPAVRGIRSRRR